MNQNTDRYNFEKPVMFDESLFKLCYGFGIAYISLSSDLPVFYGKPEKYLEKSIYWYFMNKPVINRKPVIFETVYSFLWKCI